MSNSRLGVRHPRPTPVRQHKRTSPGARTRRPLTLAQRQNRAGLAFVSPTLLVVLVVVVLPIAWTVLLAFQNAHLIDIQSMSLLGHWTMSNFQQVFSDDFWTALWTTLVYTIGGTIGSIALGLVAALALRRPFRGRGLLRGTMLLPYVAPVVAATYVWQIALSPQTGIVNYWATHYLGLKKPISFLSTEHYTVSLFGAHITVPLALLTVVAFEIWRYFPFAFLFLVARLQAVPAGLEEAAKVDGATLTQRFRHILLPQLMPVIALLSVLRFIMTFNKFDDVYLLTGGSAGTDVVSVRVYDFLTARYDIGAASAQALVLAAILIVLLGIYFLLFSKRVQEESA